MRILLLTFIAFCTLTASLQAEYLTKSERNLVSYMTSIVKVSSKISGSHVYPWVVCHNLDYVEGDDLSAVFLSSPIFQKNDYSAMYELLLFGWMTKLINQAVEFEVTRAFCSYQIDHFGRCILQGALSIDLEDGKIVNFEDVYYNDKCND